ncbi:FtsQ-type POTRA domain-containing protein [Subtercola sp. PAMC28395]|uniref:FtsQ-type POTRA domain-containing protein n=1 Tax=Subtercola sp. PAMC28395 TaxID=2846775 RepID=UPI001C0BD55B|nr:FtsQ-type POTRA domain-containing protein [Subtercola sp. PAMC28395]QWT23175.1 FtsQ-type POTRA domain-containing protein [Subtercola sp. PAMC28395]
MKRPPAIPVPPPESAVPTRVTGKRPAGIAAPVRPIAEQKPLQKPVPGAVPNREQKSLADALQGAARDPGLDAASTSAPKPVPTSAPRSAPTPPLNAQRAQRAAEAEARAAEARAEKDMRAAERQRRHYERSEARRFTERSRRRRLGWLVSLGVVVALVLVVVFTAYSPMFAVRTVAIEGTSRVDAAAVQTALSAQLGKPLALVDYGAIEADLSAFPLIQSYSTESQLPNTLVVHIVERSPVGQIASGTGFDLVDPAGVTVQHTEQQTAGFPVIDLAGGQLGGPGFLASTTVLRTLPAELLAKVGSVSAATPDSVTLVLNGGAQKVIWGSAESSSLKALVLDKLIGTQNPDSRLTYDVSSPESPVIT